MVERTHNTDFENFRNFYCILKVQLKIVPLPNSDWNDMAPPYLSIKERM